MRCEWYERALPELAPPCRRWLARLGGAVTAAEAGTQPAPSERNKTVCSAVALHSHRPRPRRCGATMPRTPLDTADPRQPKPDPARALIQLLTLSTVPTRPVGWL
jgi:hypothetical protein